MLKTFVSSSSPKCLDRSLVSILLLAAIISFCLCGPVTVTLYHKTSEPFRALFWPTAAQQWSILMESYKSWKWKISEGRFHRQTSYTRRNHVFFFFFWCFRFPSTSLIYFYFVGVFFLVYNRWQLFAFRMCGWEKVSDKRTGAFPVEEETNQRTHFKCILQLVVFNEFWSIEAAVAGRIYFCY